MAQNSIDNYKKVLKNDATPLGKCINIEKFIKLLEVHRNIWDYTDKNHLMKAKDDWVSTAMELGTTGKFYILI